MKKQFLSCLCRELSNIVYGSLLVLEKVIGVHYVSAFCNPTIFLMVVFFITESHRSNVQI